MNALLNFTARSLALAAALGLPSARSEAPPKLDQAAAVQKLMDVYEIQSLMSRHAWYYAAGQHQRELDELFATMQPDLSFGTNAGYWVGYASIKKAYVDWFNISAAKDLAALSRRHPEIKNEPRNLLAGTSMMHTITTPLIVVADDGKTAKGLFYSPGQVTQTPLGQPTAGWMWERYAIDFLKEDGQWRIWHFNVFTDFSVEPGGNWTSDKKVGARIVVQPGEVLPWEDPNAPKFDVPVQAYRSYGIDVVRGEKPRVPVPYRTFSETFSYGVPAAAHAAPSQPDMRAFIAEVDRNKDGCASHDEWFGLGLPKSAYDMLKDAKGCVTLKAMTDTPAPPGIDLNGDGKVTVAEFLEFDRRGPPKLKEAR